VTGEPFTFTNWGDGKPNNSGGEDNLHWRRDGLWNDLSGGSTQPYILEFEGERTDVPESSSMWALGWALWGRSSSARGAATGRSSHSFCCAETGAERSAPVMFAPEHLPQAVLRQGQNLRVMLLNKA
jgi:hypothetical protein